MLLIMKSIVQNYRFEEISMKHRFPSSLYFTIEFRVYDITKSCIVMIFFITDYCMAVSF